MARAQMTAHDRPAHDRPARMVVVWCRDWPVVALDLPVGEPVAIVRANRVEATSASARVAGVAEGLRRREAQRRCPEVRIVERDVDREARAFERVVATIDDITPRIEILRPGVVAFPTRGPSRYFGGDDALAIRVHGLVGAQLADPSGCGVGLADGVFAATLAAHRGLSRPSSPPITVAEGSTPGFLAPFPTKVLVSPGPVDDELVDVFGRLGLHRLADVAALDAGDVLARFGYPGTVAHRLASGFDEHPPRLGPPPDDMTVELELDPPAERVDQVAFAGKMLADRLHDASGCPRPRVHAHRGDGAHDRRGRGRAGVATRGSVGRQRRRPADPLAARRLVVEAGSGRSWRGLPPRRPARRGGGRHRPAGRVLGRDDRRRRAGPTCHRTRAGHRRHRRCGGSRAPGWSSTDRGVPVGAGSTWRARRHWRCRPRGRAGCPSPDPAVVPRRARAAEVVDDAGAAVAVSGRGALSTTPRRLSIDGGPWRRITGWAGPWLYDERWWDAVGHRRRARFQVVLEDGTAHLVVLEAGSWWLEATYD